ncbi:glycosyltransferase [Gracilibacillus caseinilyticus]|uniref:Glycosyltransferase n=1 Tax=Gracilibacillus caseinilyticus TaxID=2932256 RepID=A0ABY4EVN6_9BACI|nr:glycosyltransferase [Gracilibacillus caseinilyticus]UOQ48471.1 glycosyltransferase [Gracilibacillus caseinilyticus]
MMENALRILHVVDQLDRGETATMILNVYRNIDRNKVQFDFLTMMEGEFDEEVRRLGGHLYRISSLNEVGWKEYQKSLRQFFKGHRFYIVMHCHLDQLNTFPLIEAKRVGIPVRIAHSHNTGAEENSQQKWLYSLSGTLVTVFATDYFACSIEAAKWLFKHKAKQTSIIHNALDLDQISISASVRKQVREALKVKQHDFVIGHAGALSQQKNHAFLLDLFVGFRRRIPQTKLILIGDGSLKGAITERIKQYRLQDFVEVIDWKGNADKWIHAFDVVVYPSLHDGFPTSLVKTQYAGIPILASDRISEEIDLGNELIEFIPLHDKARWLESIHAIYEKQYRKPTDITILKKKGLDIQTVARQTEETYLELRDQGI